MFPAFQRDTAKESRKIRAKVASGFDSIEVTIDSDTQCLRDGGTKRLD